MLLSKTNLYLTGGPEAGIHGRYAITAHLGKFTIKSGKCTTPLRKQFYDILIHERSWQTIP